ERCAEEIIELTRQPEFRETDDSRKALADLALQANVRAALRADPKTRGLSFAVDSDGSKVRMRGIVATREESSSAARVVMAVPGVAAVKNELRVTSDIRSPMGE